MPFFPIPLLLSPFLLLTLLLRPSLPVFLLLLLLSLSLRSSSRLLSFLLSTLLPPTPLLLSLSFRPSSLEFLTLLSLVLPLLLLPLILSLLPLKIPGDFGANFDIASALFCLTGVGRIHEDASTDEDTGTDNGTGVTVDVLVSINVGRGGLRDGDFEADGGIDALTTSLWESLFGGDLRVLTVNGISGFRGVDSRGKFSCGNGL